MTEYQVRYAPRDAFLLLMAERWELPFVVEPLLGSHGLYSILMTRGGK